jgi:transcription elongation factor Elf1
MKASDPAPTCPNCGGNDLFTTVGSISSGGGYAPNLLPGLAKIFHSGKLRAVLCADCGLYRQFAEPDARERVRVSGRWRRL